MVFMIGKYTKVPWIRGNGQKNGGSGSFPLRNPCSLARNLPTSGGNTRHSLCEGPAVRIGNLTDGGTSHGETMGISSEAKNV